MSIVSTLPEFDVRFAKYLIFLKITCMCTMHQIDALEVVYTTAAVIIYFRICMRIRGSPFSLRLRSFSWRLLVGWLSVRTSSGVEEYPERYGDIADDHSLNIAKRGIWCHIRPGYSPQMSVIWRTTVYKSQNHSPRPPLPIWQVPWNVLIEF